MRAAGTRRTCCPSFFCITTNSFSGTSSMTMDRAIIPRRFCVSIPRSNCGQLPHIAIPSPESVPSLRIWRPAGLESRGIADWVIVTDIDEHLYHQDMYRYLAQCCEHSVPIGPVLGYPTFKERFPGHKTL